MGSKFLENLEIGACQAALGDSVLSANAAKLDQLMDKVSSNPNLNGARGSRKNKTRSKVQFTSGTLVGEWECGRFRGAAGVYVLRQ